MKLIFNISDKMNAALESVMIKREQSKASISRMAISKYLEEEGVLLNA